MSFVGPLFTKALDSLKRRVRAPLGASRVKAARQGFTPDAAEISKQALWKLRGRAGEPPRMLKAMELEPVFARAFVDPVMYKYKNEGAVTMVNWVRTLKPAERAPVITALQEYLDTGIRGGAEAALNGLRRRPGFPAEVSLDLASHRLEAWASQTQAASRVGGTEAYKLLEVTLRTEGARLIKTQDKLGLTRFFEALSISEPTEQALFWLKVYKNSGTPLNEIQPIKFEKIQSIVAFYPREQLERLLRYAATLK